MKRPDICQMKVEKCEDCRHWEPIPFHDKGGECIPRVEAPMVRLSTSAPVSKTERVPAKV